MTATLGNLIAARNSVTAYCQTCRHYAEIDLEAKAKRFGKDAMIRGSADWGPATIAGRALTCSECRSANTSIRISPPTMGGPMPK